MERLMLLLPIFAAVVGWTGWVHAANSCSPEALLACTNILASTASGQVALRMYSQQELDSLCSREFVAVKKCLQPVKADCDVSVAVVFDAFVDTLQFMCSDIGKRGYAEHGECLKQTSIQTALHQCLISHQQRSRSMTVSQNDYAKVMCGLNMEYNACLQRVVEPRCGTGAAQWVLAMSAADNKAVSHMLDCDHKEPKVTQESPIKRNTDTGMKVSLELQTPEPSVGCRLEDLNSCMKPLEQLGPDMRSLEQLTVKTLDNVCRSGLPQHTKCRRRVKSLCSPVQVQNMDMDVRTVTSACHIYIKGSTSHWKCWKQDAVQSAMTVCASTHPLVGNLGTTGSGDEGSGASGDVTHGEWCRSTQAFLDCVVDTTESSCPSQTGQWIWRIMARILKFNSAYPKCQFGYHSRTTPTITSRMPTMMSSKPKLMPSTATVTSPTASKTSSTHIMTSPRPKTMSSTPMKTSSTRMTSTFSMTSSTMSSTPTLTIKPSITSSTQDVMSLTADTILPSLSWRSSTPRTTSPSPSTRSVMPSIKSSTLSLMSSTPITMSSMPSISSSSSSSPSSSSSSPSSSSSSDLATPIQKSVPNLGSVEEEVGSSGWSIVLGGAVGVGAVVLVVSVLCIIVLLCQKLCKRGLPRDAESVASLNSNCESMAYSDKSSSVTHADYCQARDGSVIMTIPQFSF